MFRIYRSSNKAIGGAVLNDKLELVDIHVEVREEFGSQKVRVISHAGHAHTAQAFIKEHIYQ